MAQVLTRETKYPSGEQEPLPAMERPEVPHQTCLSLLPATQETISALTFPVCPISTPSSPWVPTEPA